MVCSEVKTGSKSLHLLGVEGWSSVASRDVGSFAHHIAVRGSVITDPLRQTTESAATIGFRWKPDAKYQWGVHIRVSFTYDGKIVWESTSSILEYYVGDRWYDVEIAVERQSGTADIYIDGSFKGNYPVRPDIPDAINHLDAVALSGSWANVGAYFDDVGVDTQGWPLTSAVIDTSTWITTRTETVQTSERDFTLIGLGAALGSATIAVALLVRRKRHRTEEQAKVY